MHPLLGWVRADTPRSRQGGPYHDDVPVVDNRELEQGHCQTEGRNKRLNQTRFCKVGSVASLHLFWVPGTCLPAWAVSSRESGQDPSRAPAP